MYLTLIKQVLDYYFTFEKNRQKSTHLPILCASGPKVLVPIRYDILAGRKAAPKRR